MSCNLNRRKILTSCNQPLVPGEMLKMIHYFKQTFYILGITSLDVDQCATNVSFIDDSPCDKSKYSINKHQSKYNTHYIKCDVATQHMIDDIPEVTFIVHSRNYRF